MRVIAVPLSERKFCTHFGGADEFAFVTVDDERGEQPSVEFEAAPPHARGAFPMWLRERGVSAVIAGGMGGRASGMLAAYGIEVVLGVEQGDPETLAVAYLDGRLRSRGSLCAGGGLHDCNDHDHGSGPVGEDNG